MIGKYTLMSCISIMPIIMSVFAIQYFQFKNTWWAFWIVSAIFSGISFDMNQTNNKLYPKQPKPEHRFEVIKYLHNTTSKYDDNFIFVMAILSFIFAIIALYATIAHLAN